jgi:hypothetical protein
VKLDSPGSPGFYDPAGPAKRNPALSGEGIPAKEETRPAAAGKTPPNSGRTKPLGFNLTQLTHSLGLPRDGLSVSLIGFARGFSLPLEPALLARLRKEALALKARHGGGSTESAALAAAAAAGKGVRLSGEALEQYARAIDPEYTAGEQDPREDGEGQSPDGEDVPFGERGGDTREDRRDSAGGEESARQIREILEKALKQIRQNGGPKMGPEDESPAGFLNRLPGRDGNFWMVFPFKINSKKLAIHLSIWILLLNEVYNKKGSAGQTAGSPVGGITINAVGKERRWVFSIKKPGGSGARTRVFVSPPCGDAVQRRTEEEIREVLGEFGGEVTLESGEMSMVSEIRDGGVFSAWPLFFADTASFPPVEEEA